MIMSKFTYALAVAALVLGSAFAQAAPRHSSGFIGDSQWPTDYRTENSGDFQAQGR
jgi:hypothetical protein